MPHDGGGARPIRGRQPDPARRQTAGLGDLKDRHLSGYGSPEGKVTAGAGVLWQDIDPGGSGAVYKKTTPSGNTGWVELGAAGGGSGGLVQSWSLLSEIFTPETGVVLPHYDPEYAWDEDFFYLRGLIFINSTYTGTGPNHRIGQFDPLPWGTSLPAAALTGAGANEWYGTTFLSGTPTPVGSLQMSIPGGSLGSGIGAMNFSRSDGVSTDFSGGNVVVSLDLVALAWGNDN